VEVLVILSLLSIIEKSCNMFAAYGEVKPVIQEGVLPDASFKDTFK